MAYPRTNICSLCGIITYELRGGALPARICLRQHGTLDLFVCRFYARRAQKRHTRRKGTKMAHLDKMSDRAAAGSFAPGLLLHMIGALLSLLNPSLDPI